MAAIHGPRLFGCAPARYRRQNKERVGEIELRGAGDEPIEARISTYTSIYAMLYSPEWLITDQHQTHTVAKQLLSLMPENATAVVATGADDLPDGRTIDNWIHLVHELMPALAVANAVLASHGDGRRRMADSTFDFVVP